MLIKPKQVKWQLVRYDDYTISLIKTDFEIMQENNKKMKTEKQTTTTAKELCPEKEVVGQNSEKAAKITKDSEGTSENIKDSQPTEAMDTSNTCDIEHFGVAGGKHLALKLQFTLPSSCYATTALRELSLIHI